MTWLTWPYTICDVGEQGSLSGPVVVRTVVSVQPACPVMSEMACRACPRLPALSGSNLITQQ
jgi:hypothetical protein